MTEVLIIPYHNYRDVFCCLGTTRADAGSAEAFRKIDHDYVVNSAKMIAEENPGTEGGLSPVHFLYCSSAVSIIYRNACVCGICVGQAKSRFCN